MIPEDRGNLHDVEGLAHEQKRRVSGMFVKALNTRQSVARHRRWAGRTPGGLSYFDARAQGVAQDEHSLRTFGRDADASARAATASRCSLSLK